MSIISTPTTCGFVLSNSAWTSDFVAYVDAKGRAQGMQLSFEDKEAEWLAWQNGGGSGGTMSVAKTIIYKVGNPATIINTSDGYYEEVANGSAMPLPANSTVISVQVDNQKFEPITGGYLKSGDSLLADLSNANVYVTVNDASATDYILYVIQYGSPASIVNSGYNLSLSNGSTIPVPAGYSVQELAVDNQLFEPINNDYSQSAGVITLNPDRAVSNANIYITLKKQ